MVRAMQIMIPASVSEAGGKNTKTERLFPVLVAHGQRSMLNEYLNGTKPPLKRCLMKFFALAKIKLSGGGNYFNLPPTRCFNIWQKLTISENFSMAMCEYAWCSFNENAKMYECAPQDKSRFHPTQKPISLIMWQLEKYSKPGDLILDPFSGSGTTAIAAHRLGRRFVCIEKDSEYHAASVKRLDDERRQGRLDLFPPVAKGNQSHLWTTNGN